MNDASDLSNAEASSTNDPARPARPTIVKVFMDGLTLVPWRELKRRSASEHCAKCIRKGLGFVCARFGKKKAGGWIYEIRTEKIVL